MSRIDTGALDAKLTEAVAEGRLPGAALVVSDPDGVVYEGAAGHVREGGPEVGPDTIFRMASMTKAMATVAALQLVEQGKLELDAPVADVLPRFGEPQVLTGWDGDEPVLRDAASRPTVRQLMTHTSGLGYFFTNADLARWHEHTGTPSILTGLRAGMVTPLVHDPGTVWEYGISTDWLGEVVQEAGGAPLDEALAAGVFGPLGMADATFRPTDEQRERLMTLYARQPDGGLAPTPLDLPADPEFAAGGSGAYATARDHSRFLRALLRGGELDGARILKPETVELMFTDQLAGAEHTGGITSTVPELANDVPAMPIAQGWGLGLHLRHEQLPEMRAPGSGDWAGLFNCYYWIDRSSGLSASLYTQLLPFFDMGAVMTLLGVEQALYA